jgi:hypothetical protein
LRVKNGQSLEDFILDIEEKVNEMVGESTLIECKAYKSIVKHKKRVNRVFSELGTETALQSHPLGVYRKISAIIVAVCSAAPPKARGRRASKKDKAKSDAGNNSSPVVCSTKAKSLESSKRKRKASEDIFDAEIQAASSLAKLGRKKSKKSLKKVVAFCCPACSLSFF